MSHVFAGKKVLSNAFVAYITYQIPMLLLNYYFQPPVLGNHIAHRFFFFFLIENTGVTLSN